MKKTLLFLTLISTIIFAKNIDINKISKDNNQTEKTPVEIKQDKIIKKNDIKSEPTKIENKNPLVYKVKEDNKKFEITLTEGEEKKEIYQDVILEKELKELKIKNNDLNLTITKQLEEINKNKKENDLNINKIKELENKINTLTKQIENKNNVIAELTEQLMKKKKEEINNKLTFKYVGYFLDGDIGKVYLKINNKLQTLKKGDKLNLSNKKETINIIVKDFNETYILLENNGIEEKIYKEKQQD